MKRICGGAHSPPGKEVGDDFTVMVMMMMMIMMMMVMIAFDAVVIMSSHGVNYRMRRW